MKKITLLIGVLLMIILTNTYYANAQETITWRSEAGNGNWSNTDESNINNWYRAGDGWNVRRPDLARGQWSAATVTKSYNILRFNNNAEPIMTADAEPGGAKYYIHRIQFENSTDRTITAPGAAYLALGGGSANANAKIEAMHNTGTGSYTFNIEIDYEKTVELNPVSGNLIFNSLINNNGHRTDIWGANNKTITFSGGLSGTGGLTLKQNSKVVFTSAATYSGDTFVDAGTFEIQNNFSSATITIANGAKLIINGSNVTVQNITINTGGIVEVLAGKQLTVAGTLTNNGTLTLKSDANGTATLLNSGTVSGSGTYNVEQYLAHARNWYVSSPLTAATVPASGYTIHRRNEAAATWDPVSSGTFTPGLGYVALPTAASTLNFSGGSINTGNVAIALTKSGATSNGFNLIGNPYPAHLTWLKAFTDANDALIEPTIWYRTNAGTANNSGQWSFQTYNANSGVGVPSGTTGKIPPMQAFWVRAKTAGTLTLNTTTLTRSHETGNPLKAPKVEQMPKVRLQISNEVYTDELLLYFNENASDGFDAYDSRKMFINNTVSEFYTLAENEKLVINGRQHLLDNTIVPLGINIANTGNYVIRANEISNIPTNMQVLLRDNVTSEDFDLQNSEGKTLTLNKENEISRYSLVFKVVGGTTDTQLANIKDWQIEKIGSNVFTARVSNTNNKPSRLVVYNGLGQKVQDIGFATESISFSLSTKGVYHIKLINNGVESVKSFVY